MNSEKNGLKNAEVKCPLRSGMIVDTIYLQEGIYWSEEVYQYEESTLILEIGDVFYQIYLQGEPGENHFLKVDAIPSSRMEPYSRRMQTNRMLIGAVMLNDNDQAVLIQLIDGNENLYITVDKQKQDVIFARTCHDENGEEVYKNITFIDDTVWEPYCQPECERKPYAFSVNGLMSKLKEMLENLLH